MGEEGKGNQVMSLSIKRKWNPLVESPSNMAHVFGSTYTHLGTHFLWVSPYNLVINPYWVNAAKSSCSFFVWGKLPCVGHLQSCLSKLAIPKSFCAHIFTFQWCFMSIDEGFINTLRRWICSYCWQLIIQELDLETSQYLVACSPQWQVSLHSIMDSCHFFLFEWI